MMRSELKIVFTAIMFYTRFPVPGRTGYSAENLHQATRYYPFTGILIGGLGAVVFYGAHHIFSTQVSLLIGMALMTLATGAFHEDSLSDFCDGFGGGYTRERILAIMKDSGIGTYGATALILLILSKFILVSEIHVGQIPFVIIAAHAFSRIYPVLMIYFSNYARVDESSKIKPIGRKNSLLTLCIAICFGALPLAFIAATVIPMLIISTLAIFAYFYYYVNKKLGGYTGDVLGALQQFTEVGFYLTYLVAQNLHSYPNVNSLIQNE